MKKILIVLFLSIFVFFTNFTAYEKANASAGVVDKYFGVLYGAVVTSVTAVAVVGTAATNYVSEKTNELIQVGIETWDLMSADMKQNFISSASQAGDMLTVSKDWMQAFFNNFSQGYADPFDSSLFNDVFSNVSISSFDGSISLTISSSNREFSNYMVLADGKGYSLYSGGGFFSVSRYSYNSNTVTLRIGRTNDYKYITVSSSLYNDVYNRFVNSQNTIANLIAISAAFGISVELVPRTGIIERPENPLMPLKEIYLDNPNLELDIYKPEPVPYSLDGTKLNLNTATGELTLQDGIPYTGDYTFRFPNTKVMPINGVDIPLVQNPAGDWVNVGTGEIVIPGGEVIPGEVPPGVIGALPTTGINWQPLIINGRELTTKFPFSIPWDVMRQLSVFNAEPQTPVFEVNIEKYLSLDAEHSVINIPMRFEIDFSMFNTLASVIRWFNLILFDIGLILMIRKILPE